MITGRGGMGSHKHGISGYAPRSPRYKFTQTLEAALLRRMLAAGLSRYEPDPIAALAASAVGA